MEGTKDIEIFLPVQRVPEQQVPDKVQEPSSKKQKPIKTQEPRKQINKTSLKGRGNRYYAFRNMSRLEALRRYKTLFGILQVLSILGLLAGAGALGVYFILLLMGAIFTLGQLSPNVNILNFGFYALIGGVCVFVLSIVIRILIERIYFLAERVELKRVPEGAEKYLAVIRANTLADRVNIVMWLAVVATIAVGASIDIQSSTVIGVVVGVVVAVFIARVIVCGVIYNRISGEIDQIKAERRANKETHTQY